jgi:hypothetical protein
MATRKIWKTVAEPTMAERTFTSQKLADGFVSKLREKIGAGSVKTIESVSILVSADRGVSWDLHEKVDLRAEALV